MIHRRAAHPLLGRVTLHYFLMDQMTRSRDLLHLIIVYSYGVHSYTDHLPRHGPYHRNNFITGSAYTELGGSVGHDFHARRDPEIPHAVTILRSITASLIDHLRYIFDTSPVSTASQLIFDFCTSYSPVSSVPTLGMPTHTCLFIASHDCSLLQLQSYRSVPQRPHLVSRFHGATFTPTPP